MADREFSNPNPKKYRVVSWQGKWRIWWARAEYQASWTAPGWTTLGPKRWGLTRRMAEVDARSDIHIDRREWDSSQKLNKRRHDTYRAAQPEAGDGA